MSAFYLLIPLAGLAVAAPAEKGSGSSGSAGSGKSTASTTAGSGGSNNDQAFYDRLQLDYARLTLAVMAAAAALFFLWQTSIRISAHLRRLTSLNNDTQRYFARGDSRMALLKEHVIYAPLFRTRHNREFQLSRAISMGTLPSRFQSICLAALVALNVTLCVIKTPFGQSESTAGEILRNRTGTLATVNLIPLVILAGRNNPLIPLLGLSFDTWNFFHRWLARIVVLESVTHTLAWMIPKVQLDGGWPTVLTEFRESYMIITGLVAICGFTALALHSFSALRHAFYETFLHLHIAFVLVAFIGLWYHLVDKPQQSYLLGALVMWGLERFTRLAIIVVRNFGKGRTTATVEALPGDAMRITLKMARPWEFKPGQHMYLYIPSVGLWTSHPFSVAWSQPEELITDEKGLVMSQQDLVALQKNTISLLVRRRTGFTNKLYKRAEESVGGRISLPAFAEGPYGGIHNLDSYGTLLLFAGGVGITHHVPFVRHLVAGFADGTVAARRVTLVWIIQFPEHLEWIRPWMTTILGMERRREVLRIMLFITRPRNTKEIHSPSATVQMFPGRPNIDTLIDMEIEHQVGAMGVMVCGTGSLSDDVRRACRKRQTISNIDFIEESFSW
ncbi:hypothetical protein VTN77DRAFT_5841 [Rasamsonia byssochlamydoides]|uniref:uncharacterized protein n=1 Tax=Rasamsonia byssochlamydoides TaxID=89139 RepID=UPI0037427C70